MKVISYDYNPTPKFLSGSVESMKEMTDISLEKEKRRIEALKLLKESAGILGIITGVNFIGKEKENITNSFTVLGSLLGIVDTKLSFYERYTNRKIEKSILEFAVNDINAEIRAISSGVDRIKNYNNDNDRKLEVTVLIHSCEKVLNKFENPQHIFYKHPLITTPCLIGFCQLYLTIIEVGVIVMSASNNYNYERQKIKKVIEEYKVNSINDRTEMIKIKKSSKCIGYDSHMIKEGVMTYMASLNFSETYKQITENDFIRNVDDRASSKRLKVQNKNQYGKHGSIAICFFRGVIVDDNSLQNQPGLADRGSDNNENEDLDYTTEFDVKDANIQPATVAKIVNLKPIAELHLHYRSEDWLTNRGFSLPILSDVNGEKEEDVNLITDEENKVNELPKLSQVLTKIENNNVKQIDEPLEIEANGNDVNPKVNKNAKNSQELMEIDKLIAKETRRLNDISQEIMEFERKKKEDQIILKRARDEIDEIDKI
ncbi:12891_t:CDS:2 [Funneliformis caledonium]|uniref:12891_t:CDS:1 n=1 Tax=Funneliformis caledonium TaxID=1117310 RepID=A0A9N9D6R9_9GLOM|nr:12891_t:CDS:2 [Funneliformis caledonium]